MITATELWQSCISVVLVPAQDLAGDNRRLKIEIDKYGLLLRLFFGRFSALESFKYSYLQNFCSCISHVESCYASLRASLTILVYGDWVLSLGILLLEIK